MLNYDPDGIPDVDSDAIQRAQEYGMRPIHVTCDEPNAKVGDLGCVSFLAFVHFVPRTGETITLEDGTVCRVHNVHFKVTDIDGFKSLIPNIDALRVSQDHSTDRGKG